MTNRIQEVLIDLESETNQISAHQLVNKISFDCQCLEGFNFIRSDLGMSASVKRHKNDYIFFENPINTELLLPKQPPKNALKK